jgi:hypothetical protein
MAGTVNVVSRSANQKTVDIHGTIVLSGTYATGGEALPLASLKAGTSKKPHFVAVVGKAGFTYQYDIEAEKLKTFAGATETTAGAYPAGITGDVIRFVAQFPKFG